MAFIILIIVGAAGMAGTLYLSSGISREPAGSEPWYALHPENLESGLTRSVRTWIRGLLRTALIWMIRRYRQWSEKITVKQVLKQRVRQFLYEHEPGGSRHPSEFWNKVKSRGDKDRPSTREPEPVLENEEGM